MKTVPVVGQVRVDGGTVELPRQVLIKAHLVSGESATSTEPAAYVDPDGSFSFSTYESGDGVPVGEYKLTFQLGQRNMMRARFEGDEFKGKYSIPEKSDHSLKVAESDTEPIDLGTIELQTK